MKKLHTTALLLTVTLILSGCTEQTNTLTPGADTNTPSEFSENNFESGEDLTSGNGKYQPYEEFFVDKQFLESFKQNRLYVKVYLSIPKEVFRAEYEEKYPELVESQVFPDYWWEFLENRGNQLIREFMSDYDIDYEEIERVDGRFGFFCCELDKDTISTMLNDTRVAEIIYYIGDGTIVEF